MTPSKKDSSTESDKTDSAKFEKLKEKFRKEGSKPGAEERVKKSFFSYFKKNESNISFGSQIEKIYDLLISGKLSGGDKALIIGALLYFINPFDLVPDIAPIVGFLDDMGVIGLVYRYLSNRSLEASGAPGAGKNDNNA